MELKEGKMWGIVPFVVMFLVEGCAIALTITAKSAMGQGMNQFVFVAYTNALSSVLLLTYSLIFHRDSMKRIFTKKLMARFFLLGLTGVTIAQNLAFTGLRDSSPIVVCAMGMLLPSYQFFLSLLLGKAKLNWRVSTRIKIAGVMISIFGALMVACYMGPPILSGPLFHHRLLQGPNPLFIFISATNEWMFGTFLLAAATFFIAIWGMIQVSTFTSFPDMMVIVTCYTIFGTFQTAFVDIMLNGDLNAWKLKMDLELLIIILTALFGTLGRSRIQAWVMSLKGPMYVAMFKPAGIFWACTFGLSLFGSALKYGNVIGTIIVGVGYFTILYGVKREGKEDQQSKSRASEDIKAPLLQQQNDQQNDEQV